ncbi:MlaD family protein [Negadavirga shengliensis]|uniref:MlaD family protein n=1 Tax=Negadavirga shengliensis TaxID=1389218 RepID=A0ABV9T4B1_9BACT
MRDDNKKTVIVGIFVLIGIIILVAGILTLGSQQKTFVRSLRVFAVFDDVAGLQAGNNVWFSGVKVGTVKKINFYGDSQVEIEMNIESSTKDYIRKNSKATISSDGLIGNKIIVIYGGTNDAPSVEPGDRLEAVMPLDTDKMMETLQVNNQNLVAITEDLKVLIHKITEGEGIVGTVMTDTALAGNFKNILVNLERTAINSTRLSNDLNKVTAKLNQPGTLLDDLLTDTTVFSNLKTAAESLGKTTDDAQAAAENVKQISDNLLSTDNTAGMLLNDEEFAAYLKSTLENLDTGTASFNETMEALRYHWLFRRSFRKRDQAAEAAAQD